MLRHMPYRRVVKQILSPVDAMIMGLPYDHDEKSSVPRYYESWSVVASGGRAKNGTILRYVRKIGRNSEMRPNALIEIQG